MRVCIFGAGSLGSVIGGMLVAKHDVTLVGRRQHMDSVRRHGLRLLGDVRRTVRMKAVVDPSEVESPDLLLISTKAYDTTTAINECKRFVDDRTKVLTLQNGLGNLELLRTWKGSTSFGGTTTMGAVLASPGTVRVSGLGRTVIGADMDPDGARSIARAFESCGIPVHVKKDVIGEIWGKAVVNACINPTAAVLRVRNGVLLTSATTVHFMREVCSECEQVAFASGISLPDQHMYARVQNVCSDTADNFSSMLQDVLKGRRTEIQQINGAFCVHGRARGVRTPLNETLVAMIEPLQFFSKGERLIS